MNGHSDMVGMMESGEISHEDFEPPSFDEEKERRAGFFDSHDIPSQEAMLIKELKNQYRWHGSEGGITSTRANIKLSIGRLASRIHNLIHRDGYVIDKNWITVVNQFGKKVRVVKYSYDPTKNANSHCLNCGSLIGKDCGDAEPDYNDYFCSKLCNIQWRK